MYQIIECNEKTTFKNFLTKFDKVISELNSNINHYEFTDNEKSLIQSMSYNDKKNLFSSLKKEIFGTSDDDRWLYEGIKHISISPEEIPADLLLRKRKL